MEIKGIITQVCDIVRGESQNGPWERQDVVVSYGSVAYPRKIVMTLSSSKIKDIQPYAGMRGTFSFDIDAREYQGRWFNSINLWKVEKDGEQQTTDAQAPANNQKGALDNM